MNFRSDAASVVKGSPTLIRRTEFAHFSFNVASSEQRCSIDIEPNQVIVSQDNERGADLVISGPPAWHGSNSLSATPAHAKPAHAEEVARLVSGSRLQTMKDLGHFPPSENDPLLCTYLLPILAEIGDQSH